VNQRSLYKNGFWLTFSSKFTGFVHNIEKLSPGLFLFETYLNKPSMKLSMMSHLLRACALGSLLMNDVTAQSLRKGADVSKQCRVSHYSSTNK
jgi:hypothetical protein